MLSEDSLLLSSRAKSTFFNRPHTLLLFFLPHLFMVIFILPGLSFFSVRGPFQCSVSESVTLFTFLDQYFFFFYVAFIACLKTATNTFPLRATYALEQQRTSLNLHTKKDAIMSMLMQPSEIICCNLLNNYSSQGKLFSNGSRGKQYIFL